jgi:hypothetical protein
MNEPIEQAVAIAIESYVHAPRTLSVLEVVRQVTAVFPDQDHAKIAHGVRESRRMLQQIAREGQSASRIECG